MTWRIVVKKSGLIVFQCLMPTKHSRIIEQRGLDATLCAAVGVREPSGFEQE